jgi:hypothetical protein
MRRAPQLWEQRLARTTAILGAGISSSGDATAIVPPSAPPGAGGGTEPAPVAPAPGLFIAPSTPTLIGSVQGINVVWNGLNSAGDLWPSDTSYVEVHMSTAGTGFTPDASTLKGRLARPGGLAVTGLTSGVTYHFRLRGADPAGNFTSAGAAASGTPGLITGPDIAANAITANSIVAGTITGWSINAAFLSGGTVSGGFITGGTVSGGFITGGTVEGAALQTSGGNSRIRIRNDVAVPFGSSDAIDFFGGGTSKAQVTYNNAVGAFIVYSNDIAFIDYNNAGTARVEVNGSFDVIGTAEAQSFRPTGNVIVFQGYRTTNTAGDVIMRLQSNVTNTGEAKFEVDADGDVKSRTNSYAGFSDARYKENITPARDYLDDLREVDVVTFNWQGSDQKLLGVTAQQIQPIFPNMVAEDEDGTLSVRYSVFVPMLITAVQSLATEVEDLRARIEALEA